jgi:hypothetical protein
LFFIDDSNHTIASLKPLSRLALFHKGVFNVGNIQNDDLAMQWVCGEDTSGGARDAAISTNIFVYGSSVYALHTIECLIRAKVKPASIIWAYKNGVDMGYEQVNFEVIHCFFLSLN